MTSPQRILFIDDDPDTLALCANTFRKNGYIVQTLLGCEDLLEFVERFSPHLIFMDHNMPVICGTDAIKLLKSHSNSNHIPVILFSAEVTIEQLASECGADAYLKKPFRMDTLIDATERIALID